MKGAHFLCERILCPARMIDVSWVRYCSWARYELFVIPRRTGRVQEGDSAVHISLVRNLSERSFSDTMAYRIDRVHEIRCVVTGAFLASNV